MALTYKEIFELNNFQFLKWLKMQFPVDMPKEVTSADEMELASKQMLALSAEYSYISEISSYAKVYCRELKRLSDNDKDDPQLKSFYEDMVDKREAIDNKMAAIKQAYNGISRAVSVRIENNQELRLTGSRFIA